jgi:hypothetical protein
MAERAAEEPEVLVDSTSGPPSQAIGRRRTRSSTTCTGVPQRGRPGSRGIGGIDPEELDAGDIATLERPILERIEVERRGS